jgi:hypothetical protein
VKSLGLRHWKLPKLAKPQEITCQFTISTPDEAELARNQLKLFVLPASERNAKYQGEVAVITRNTGLTQAGSDLAMLTPENEGSGESGRPGVEQMPVVPQHQSARASSLSHALEELGYNVNTHLTLDTRLAISNYPNEELLRWVREGGDLLFISNGPSPFYWVQGRGGAYSGNWMSSFSWLRPGIYRRLENVSNPLEMPFKRIMPTGTILGLPVNQPEMHADFLAGQVGGWVNLPAVHTVQFRYGQGRVIMTTFELIKSLQEFHDPVAVAMLHDLVEYLASDQCQPRLTANF